jgi:lipopolysaccharide assembly protein A
VKGQWTLILALIFALIVAVFAVINVDPVEVNYLFGTANWPLILIILSSVLMGGIIVASVGIFRMFVLQRKIKQLEKENKSLNEKIAETQPLTNIEENNQFPDVEIEPSNKN